MPPAPTLEQLRRYAIARSLFAPTTLRRAIDALGFVQADPIRAPARAQDLTLRHRVKDYRAGDLERRYADLPIDEEYFVNYGFLPTRHLALMHPRIARRAWDKTTTKRAAAVLEFVREHGEVHPREVDEHFAHGSIKNYWGGQSSVTTHLLDAMHYRGLLRVARRDNGIRVYAVRPENDRDVDDSPSARAARADALVKLAVAKYAPLPATSLGPLVSRLRFGAPQLASELRTSLQRARLELPHARVGNRDWYWPLDDERALASARELDLDRARMLAPFDPVVWDRARFELFWGWAYRFEAYTPIPKRKLGYYALPLLWRDKIVGWANVAARAGTLDVDVGYVAGRPPRDRAFRRALDADVEAMRRFLTPIRS